MLEEATKLQHLMAAYEHLAQVAGFELEIARIKAVVQVYLATDTADLKGTDLIDRLTDEELKAAIQIREPRLGLYSGPHICPEIFNYIRNHRPQAAVLFYRKY